MTTKTFKTLFFLSLLFLTISSTSQAYEPTFARTLGGSIYGSFQLVDTLPIVDPGLGGGLFFDYRFNQRFAMELEAFVIFQDGDKASAGEGGISFYGIPTGTLKMYFLSNATKLDPYFGVGLGVYMLSEGGIDNNTFGVGLGAQIAVGLDYNLTDHLVLSAGGTYRSVGLINSLNGTSNASTYMPYTLFGRVGYRF